MREYCLIIALAAVFFSGVAEAHLPMQTEYAETLPRAGWEFKLHAGYMDMSKDPGGAVAPSDTMTEQMYEATVGYGLTSELSVYLKPSYKAKEMEMVHSMMGMTHLMKEDSSGIGDTDVYARYRLYRGDEKSAAVLIGVKLPTGADDVESGGRRLMDMTQPGTGSYDYRAGTAATFHRGAFTIDADAIYRINGKNSEDYKFGNVLNLDIAALYRIEDFYLMGEINGLIADKDEAAGTEDDNTGGTQVFVTPGLSYHLLPNLMLMFSVQLPVYQDMNGNALGTNYHAMGGVHWFY